MNKERETSINHLHGLEEAKRDSRPLLFLRRVYVELFGNIFRRVRGSFNDMELTSVPAESMRRNPVSPTVEGGEDIESPLQTLDEDT